MSNETGLATASQQTHALAAPGSLTFGEQEKKLILDAYCPGATETEAKIFLAVSEKMGLDPLKKQIHAVKRWDSENRRNMITYQVGIDGLRAIAQRTGEYFGQDAPEYDSETAQHPNWCKVTVYRIKDGVRVPFTGYARYSEFVQTKKGGDPNMMWANKPYRMLAKCAEAEALRKGFPNEIGGMYSDEEMGATVYADVREVDEVELAGGVPEPDLTPKQIQHVEAEEVIEAETVAGPNSGVAAMFWGNWKRYAGNETNGDKLGDFPIAGLRNARVEYGKREGRENQSPQFINALKASCHDEVHALIARTFNLNYQDEREKVESAVQNQFIPAAVFSSIITDGEDPWNNPLSELTQLAKAAKTWTPES